MPGFTLLRVYDVREWNKKYIDIIDNETVLSNKSWKRGMKTNSNVINGPCISGSTFSRELKTIFSIQKGCPCVNQIYYRSVPIKLLPEQCHVLMILVAIHTTGVYQSIVFLQRAT
jgi:hypothetical protein